MTSASESLPILSARRRVADRVGDRVAYGITATVALLVVVVVGLVVYKLVDGAWPSMSHFGISFVWDRTWDPNRDHYGALSFLYGTAVTSFGAMLLAAPLSIAIGLYLSELAPRGIRTIVGTLVEMLAAIPSVVLGLWGILVFGPFSRDYIESWLKTVFGWIPIFGGTPSQAGILIAILILTIMIVPITSSISRELFANVPADLKEGAYGLGLTRWEMVRGVILPFTRAGVVAAIILGTGRAIGEAIAVSQVIGNRTAMPWRLFEAGNTLPSVIANTYQGASTRLQTASLVYLAVILLVFTVIANLAAQWVVNRYRVK